MDLEIGIVAQRGNERAQQLAGTLVTALESESVSEVVVDEETGSAIDEHSVPVDRMQGSDLLVSIGGDGTLLFAVREAGDVPIVGINLGEVGFLNAVQPENAVEVVTGLVAERRETGTIDGRDIERLRASGAEWELPPALNEIVVHGPKRGPGGGATIEIRVDDHRYTESHADGVLVATPTGSTAYNLSEGGPLVRPSVDVLVVTQMASAEPMRPLIVDSESRLELSVRDAETAYAIGDGRTKRKLSPPATVTITTASEPASIVGPSPSFFESLEKLE